MDRGPDAESFVGDRADFLDPQRGGGALHGVGTDRQRDVDAVVHDQERAGVDRDGADAPAEEGQVRGAQVLLPHLYGRQPGREAGADEAHELPAPRLGAVGDEGEPQLVQSGTPSSGEDAVA